MFFLKHERIHNHNYIEIRYQGIQGSTVKTRKLKPLAVMFSEYYFYMAALIDDEKVRENFNVINDSWENGKRNIFREKRFIENSIKAKKSFISCYPGKRTCTQ